MTLSPGTLSPIRSVPADIERPEYVGRKGPRPFTGSEVKTPDVIEFRTELPHTETGKLLRRVLLAELTDR